ncbi:ribosome biogenesis protein ytm1 [Emydomyces testavorans]|uniref:Ribosome biogenesis protein ytm1 n=1 Tax=Emydomyces testavorans TaxID=2070801 RepID=A0AAF0DM24_9EURO|nr:ribosome biogenesis protein ytm1 [Emydomyces testavorans]
MAPVPSKDAVCQALLKFVTDGQFPDSESLVATEFPLEIIPKELHELARAKKEVENEISALSRETVTNVDDWMTQAKQLHQDIERSRLTAREIVTLHEKGRNLCNRASDAQSTVDRLREEIAFNGVLLEALEEARSIDDQLAAAQLALGQNQWIRSIELLEEITGSLTRTKLPQQTNVVGLLSTKAADLRASIAISLRTGWKSLVKVDPSSNEITITLSSSGTPNFAELDCSSDILTGLSRLQILDSVFNSFQKDFINYILRPVIFPIETGEWRTFSVDEKRVRLTETSSKPSISDILNGILSTLSYLKENLPPIVIHHLCATLAGTIVAPLTSKWLTPSLPSDVSSLDAFQGTLDQVRQFVVDLEEQGWGGLGELSAWIAEVPRLWLSQRRAKALDDVRIAMSRSSGKIRKVERIERECVSENDGIPAEDNAEDDWNAEWSDNEHEKAPEEPGVVDDSRNGKNESAKSEEEADETWDWDDENEETPAPVQTKGDAGPSTHTNGHGNHRKGSQRELILKESYAITNLPDAIIAIISDQLSDAEDLAKLGNSQLKLASSRPALLALPTLIVAMFKATAPMFYSHRFNVSQMYVYNDCMYLAEQLRVLSEARNLPKLSSDSEAVDKFGKAAYGKELHSQRTILTDLLDGCQGFSNCSEEPFLGECKNAMAAAVDRLKDVYKEWQPILSRSALLQSIGSLISTAVNKLILDIEDLSDISDAESRQLADFCSYLSKLEDLFIPEPRTDPHAANQPESIPMTAMYVPNWLKFQYLINILESSLADIKYLWTEGELKLEFDAEELVDLIKALFADSDHRKRAIMEIRRTSGVS